MSVTKKEKKELHVSCMHVVLFVCLFSCNNAYAQIVTPKAIYVYTTDTFVAALHFCFIEDAKSLTILSVLSSLHALSSVDFH